MMSLSLALVLRTVFFPLRQVLQSIRQAGLTIHSRKCQFGMSYCLLKVQPKRGTDHGYQKFPSPKDKEGCTVASRDTAASSSPIIHHLQRQ